MIVDYAVPIGVMMDALFAAAIDLTRDGIGAYLAAHYRLGLLTHAENTRLDAIGLRSAMPIGWTRDEVFARYRPAAIEPAPASF